MASFAPDTLLASRLSLPESPCIYYVLLKPTSGVSPVESIENARRSILNAASSGVLDSVLSSVQISEDSFIYLFRLSQRLTSGSLDDLFGCLDFKGLEGQFGRILFSEIALSSFGSLTISSSPRILIVRIATCFIVRDLCFYLFSYRFNFI